MGEMSASAARMEVPAVTARAAGSPHRSTTPSRNSGDSSWWNPAAATADLVVLAAEAGIAAAPAEAAMAGPAAVAATPRPAAGSRFATAFSRRVPRFRWFRNRFGPGLVARAGKAAGAVSKGPVLMEPRGVTAGPASHPHSKRCQSDERDRHCLWHLAARRPVQTAAAQTVWALCAGLRGGAGCGADLHGPRPRISGAGCGCAAAALVRQP